MEIYSSAGGLLTHPLVPDDIDWEADLAGVHGVQLLMYSGCRCSQCGTGRVVIECACGDLTPPGLDTPEAAFAALVAHAEQSQSGPAGPEWLYLDVDYRDDWHGCEHCGTPYKRGHLLEHATTGRRLMVGKNCVRKLLAIGR